MTEQATPLSYLYCAWCVVCAAQRDTGGPDKDACLQQLLTLGWWRGAGGGWYCPEHSPGGLPGLCRHVASGTCRLGLGCSRWLDGRCSP